jgi:hypothetical protein
MPYLASCAAHDRDQIASGVSRARVIALVCRSLAQWLDDRSCNLRDASATAAHRRSPVFLGQRWKHASRPGAADGAPGRRIAHWQPRGGRAHLRKPKRPVAVSHLTHSWQRWVHQSKGEPRFCCQFESPTSHWGLQTSYSIGARLNQSMRESDAIDQRRGCAWHVAFIAGDRIGLLSLRLDRNPLLHARERWR